MKITCSLVLDKKRQRKWVITEFDKSLCSAIPELKTGMTVSIGAKYIDKLKFNLGDTVSINSENLIYRTGYFIYNDSVEYSDEIKVRCKNPISLEHDGFYLDDKMFDILSRNINKQINTLLLGPTGSGNFLNSNI